MPERDSDKITACPECGRAISRHDREETGQAEYCAACYRATLDDLLGEYRSAREPEGFVGLGPDEDFSGLEASGAERMSLRRARETLGRWRRARQGAPEKEPRPRDEVAEVVATLVRAGDKEEPPRQRRARPRLPRRSLPEAGVEDLLAAEELAAARLEARAERREDLRRRWDFMYQQRAAAATTLAPTRGKAAVLSAAVILAAALAWSLPNAFVFSGDNEFALHAVLIGIGIGLALWWRAGKAHSTRLALQAAGLTLAGLFLGELLHWTFVIASNSFFRTVFDMITTKFFFTNLPDVMGKLIPELFPFNFILILVLPALLAFAIGFGAPPIPEIFVDMARAIRPGHGGGADPDA